MSNSRRPPKPNPDVAAELTLPTEHVADDTRTTRLIEEMKETVDKFARDHATRGDLKLISRTLRELRYAFKVFTPYRRHRKVTVFGSARTVPDHPAYQAALEFGRQCAEDGWLVVTGAGGGIMEAAHVGAGRKMSMGLNIILPFEQEANYVITKDEKLVNLKYFFTRKLMFVKEVDAVALFPGGFGTLDELFETLTLIQTGKRDLMPVVLVDAPGGEYWKGWFEFIQKDLYDQRWISPDDLSLFKITDDVTEAVDEVMKFYSVYNSMRYVRDHLYLRLHARPGPELLDRINAEYASILSSGKFELAAAHEAESEDEHLQELTRLVFKFNRRDLGKLRQLVNLLNEELSDQVKDSPAARPA